MAGILRFVLPAGGEADVVRYREVRDFVRANYVRDVSDQTLLDGALHGMVEGLDRYSRFLDRSQVADFERETGGQYRGIGVVFRDPPREGQVLFCLAGSPAERAGVRVGDRLVSVDGARLADLPEGELARRVSAAVGASLDTVVVSRDGVERSVRIEPLEIVDPTVRHARVVDRERGIAYLAITSFSHRTPEEFDQALDAFAHDGVRGLILDVRGNPGGVLASAVRIANRFLDEGAVVTTEGRAENSAYDASPGEARYAKMPLVVLIDGDSASASEVLAGALQDHRAAVLVGSPSYGKGMVQKIRTFGEHDAIVKLTSSYYYTPSHRNLERTVDKAWAYGLVPDFAVETSAADRKRLHAFLASHSPPPGALDELRRWEREEGVALVATPPNDRDLDAALALLCGRRPALVASLDGSATR
ncbi:MAG: S41 family peptidase [Planctomycetes bacterium]|nr:S41 family peptidase [Planctomycetota bacterium]